MTFFGLIKNWIFATNKRQLKSRGAELYPLHIQEIAKELSLEEEAKRLGQAGIPSPDATSISGPEASVVQRIERARQDFIGWASIRIAVLNETLSNLDATKIVNRSLLADREFERKASEASSQNRTSLK